MKKALVTRKAQNPVIALEKAQQAAAAYARNSRSPATWRAYESDWNIFRAWSQSIGQSALPATSTTVALFLAAEAQAGRAPATLDRRLAAIRLMHVGAKLPSPHDAIEVAEVMSGIRRAWQKPPAQKAPAVDDQIQRLVDAVEPQTLKGLRDRALLLLGFAGAFRRSELVALDVAQLTRVPDEGLSVQIPRSKADQEGSGQLVAIAHVENSPYCPVQAVYDWLVAADISSGAVFLRMYRGDVVGTDRMTSQSVALIIKDLALKVGLDPIRYAGHSLRSGFATSAARNRANIFKIAAQTRHKKLDTLRAYVRDAELFEDHAAAGMLQPNARRR